MPGKGWNCLLRLYASLEHDGFELNRRKHLLHLAPLAGRGRNSLREFRVRGPIRESDLVERPPHPQPSPRKRGEGEAVRRLNLNSSCSSLGFAATTRRELERSAGEKEGHRPGRIVIPRISQNAGRPFDRPRA